MKHNGGIGMPALILLVIVIGGIVLYRTIINDIIVFEFERGLKYRKGRFKGVLEPGRYRYRSRITTIQKVDIRPRFASITGQEVLSADGITLKVSIAANYQVADPVKAVNTVQNYDDALYQELQLALREIIGIVDIETILSKRSELSKQLMTLTAEKAKAIGLALLSVNVKDIMFPGKLKEMFAQVANAKQEGLAALEKARSETAALRSLANAARMLDDNPNLMQLRLVQALGESTGNTLVLGMPNQSITVPVSKMKNNTEEGQ